MLSLALALCVSAAPKPVLMVLYFDNHTNRPELDVMKKGLAEMLITDLIAYDGVTVVERDRFEAVVGELKLQQGKGFDPAAHAKLGKLVGATHAVSGSMLALSPEVRLDARLTEISTGKDLVSATVRGPPEKLFDLEQELVSKLTASIDAKLIDPTASKKLKGADVDSLLAYSKGLDLADTGHLEEAKRALDELISKRPTFYLPRERVAALVKRLQESSQRKEDLLSSQGLLLLAAADEALKQDFDGLPPPKQLEYLQLQAWRSHLLMLSVRSHLSARDPKERPILRGHEAQVLQLTKAVFENERSLAGHVAQVRRKTKTPASSPLPERLHAAAADVGLADVDPLSDNTSRAFSDFALIGHLDVARVELDFVPAPVELDLKLKADVEKTLLAELDALFARRTEAAAELTHHRIYYTWLKYYSWASRGEDAVVLMQKFLDAFPTSRHFRELEVEVKAALGVGPHDMYDWDLAALHEQSQKTCARGNGAPWRWLHERARQAGIAGMQATVAEAERACGSKASTRDAKQLLEDYDEAMVVELVRWDECALARDYATRYCRLDGEAPTPTCLASKLQHCAGK